MLDEALNDLKKAQLLCPSNADVKRLIGKINAELKNSKTINPNAFISSTLKCTKEKKANHHNQVFVNSNVNKSMSNLMIESPPL